MKIVDRKTFIALPSGVLFSKYERCLFDEIMIKGESIIFDSGDDFYYQAINDAIESNSSDEFVDKLLESESVGTNIRMDFHCEGRDGLYESNQLYAVWSTEDIENFMARLKHCIGA